MSRTFAAPILGHPFWPVIKRFVHIETYDRDGGHRHPRHRIEVDLSNASPTLRTAFLRLEVPCVHCHHLMHPIRERRGGRPGAYLSVSCELRSSYACARGKPARNAYEAIVAAMYAPPSRDWLL